jgi:hypothetical protein
MGGSLYRSSDLRVLKINYDRVRTELARCRVTYSFGRFIHVLQFSFVYLTQQIIVREMNQLPL